MVDYERLLAIYIAHVVDNEGTDFIESSTAPLRFLETLSVEEAAALRKAAEGARELDELRGAIGSHDERHAAIRGNIERMYPAIDAALKRSEAE